MRSGFSWLDFKLGARMLVKYPGLTLVGGLAISFAIAVGAAAFEFITGVVYPRMPLPEGDRIVAVRMWNAETNEQNTPRLHDFAAWREELGAVEDIGAYRTLSRNLTVAEGDTEPVQVAEMSAAAFRVTRVAPLLGRTLLPEDEQPGAAPVLVIGYRAWQNRFGADPAIIGRTVQLHDERATVVGVMPEDYGFPISHSYWVPLRLNPLEYAAAESPRVRVFGRLAPDVNIEEAQAVISTLGSRAAAAMPETHAHLRPQVVPYTESSFNLSTLEAAWLLSINVFLIMLLVLICANVALLMFARAAARESEIVVRSALGASRGRIVMQLFAEALVLSAIGAALGLAAAREGLQRGLMRAEMNLPFWINADISIATVGYAMLLAVIGAAVAGVLPALKMTGMQLESQLRQKTAGGGVQFGGVWTAVIVAQVAITVAFPVVTFLLQRDAAEVRSLDPGFATEEYLAVQVSPGAATTRADYDELERHLEAQPGVRAVTFATQLPLMYHPHRVVETDEGMVSPPGGAIGHRVSSVSVAPDYFDVVDAPILSGRGFDSGDVVSERAVVIVNQSFVDRVLGGRNPVGRRVRYMHIEDGEDVRQISRDEAPEWYEIVGVVRDIGMDVASDAKSAGFYHPVSRDVVETMSMAVHVNGDPQQFAPIVRAAAAAVDPSIRLDRMLPLEQVKDGELLFMAFWYRLTTTVSAIALLLSLSAIYAVMSFTVSRRTREIGVRIALGADARRVLLPIFRRPLRQIAIGVAAGTVLSAGLTFIVEGAAGPLRPVQIALLSAYGLVMMMVCMLACIVPTRRALGIEPTEAMRADT